MKIRNGFVSNSSSSSFIVAVDPQKTKIKITLEVDFEKLSEKRIQTFDQLKTYLMNKWGWEWEDDENSRDWQKEIFENAKDAINRGKVILLGSFSNQSGNVIEEFLCSNGIPRDEDNKDLEIIFNESGF